MSLITCSECSNEVSTKAQNCPHCGAPVVAEPPASSLREDPPTPPLLSSSETAPGAKAEIPDFSPWKDSDSRWWITPAGQKAASLLVQIRQETGQLPSMQARESICLLCMQEGPSIMGESIIGSRSGNTCEASGKKGKQVNGFQELLGVLSVIACLGFGLAPIYFIFAGESEFPHSIALRALISVCCLALAWAAFSFVRKLSPILAKQERTERAKVLMASKPVNPSEKRWKPLGQVAVATVVVLCWYATSEGQSPDNKPATPPTRTPVQPVRWPTSSKSTPFPLSPRAIENKNNDAINAINHGGGRFWGWITFTRLANKIPREVVVGVLLIWWLVALCYAAKWHK